MKYKLIIPICIPIAIYIVFGTFKVVFMLPPNEFHWWTLGYCTGVAMVVACLVGGIGWLIDKATQS